LLVSHDIDEVIGLADRIYMLSGNPAHVVAEVPIRNPRSLRNADEVAAIRHTLMQRAAKESA
jgi:NitT/TauT family transport system ATP-binding protein